MSALSLIAGPAHPSLASSVAQQLGVPLARAVCERFPDSELHVELCESVRGDDVYVLQPSSPPADENLLALILLADACRRAGAARVTAVMPYFGYARQDRRASGREPVSARVMADLTAAAQIARVVAIDLHAAAIEGFFSVPLEHLSAVPLLADAVRPWLPEKAVVVSPDVGGVKLAVRYARHLDLPVAVVHKTRQTAEAVTVERIVGDVRGRTPVVVDDMISTGGTIEAAVQALIAAGSAPDVGVVASHALLVGQAVARVSKMPVRWLMATDSVPLPPHPGLPLHRVGLAPLLAVAIQRLHSDQSLSDLILHR
jgi:ribose-phosphate pyrophosphokinase